MNRPAQGHQIYHLRHTQMDERLALLLSPIISAYRPHDDIPTREQLGDPVTRTTCNPFTKLQ
ncbi:hypothetical protein [Synechococcus phage S-B05]|nr:hypothetical protein [Synechococcus phage S-B05]QCW22842.1 hypothetical protein [Synechococcus phage S-B05]